MLLMYDVTNRDSFIGINKRMNSIFKHARNNVVVILVGNKCDEEEKREVSCEEEEEMASRYGIPFLNTSAKNNTNVTEIFQLLTKEMKDRRNPPYKQPPSTIHPNITRSICISN